MSAAASLVGRGRRSAWGRSVELPFFSNGHAGSACAEWLASCSSPDDVDAWWTPAAYGNNHRGADDWRAAWAVVADIDWQDDAGAHVSVPADVVARIDAGVDSGLVPATVVHETPRGFRCIGILSRLVTDPGEHAAATRGYLASVDASLAGLALPRATMQRVPNPTTPGGRTGWYPVGGFYLDPSVVDRAQIFWAPRTTVGGVRRDATPRAVEGSPRFDPAELAALDPGSRWNRAPEEKAQRRATAASSAPARASSDLLDAVNRYRQDHARDFGPGGGGPCPVCEGNNHCFGRTGQDPDRWTCFHATHPSDVGVPSADGSCVTGDVLDIDAYAAGRTRAEHLRLTGYLADRTAAPRRPPEAAAEDAAVPRMEEQPEVLIPGRHLPEGAPAIDVGTNDFADDVLRRLPVDLLYRLGEVAHGVIGTIEGASGARSFCPLDETRARTVIDRHVRLIRKRKRAEKQPNGSVSFRHVTEYVPCTRDLAALVLSCAKMSRSVRELRALVRHPVYLPGFELAAPGWNTQGRVYYDEPEHLRGIQPCRDLASAIATLADLVVDFPLKDEASRCGVFAWMTTHVIRHAIDGPTPFFFFMAALERTGKGKLVDTTSIAVSGSRPSIMQIGRSEEEREKRITSLILRGETRVHFDNLPAGEELDSASVASLGTAWPLWGGRVLGRSEVPALPNVLLVAITGNNPKASGEIAKRSIPIVLESRTADPESRTDFLHADCYAYAKDRQRAVLAALLGIVEGWKAAGRPASVRRLGGYERWVDAVGGILEYAGCRDFLENHGRWIRRANDFQADAEALIGEWQRQHGTEPVTATLAFRMAEASGLFGAVLAKGRTDHARLIAFSRGVLEQLVDRPVAGKVVRRQASGSNATYVIEDALA